MPIHKLLLAVSVAALLAGCSSDGVSGVGGGGGSVGTTSLAIPQQGVTGEGGLTDSLGIAALTDPILGTDGSLGGGGDGQLGGQIPSDQLAPLAQGLAPVVEPLAAALPLSLVADTVPPVGLTGEGGLLDDLTGLDPVGPSLGTNGLVGAAAGGGNNGLLGAAVPEGAVPTLGLGGAGGLSDDIAHQDLVTALLGDTSPVAHLLGGGQDGALGSAADAAPDLPVPAVPGIGAPAHLGLAGDGGLVDDLTQVDVLTAVLGTEGAIPSALQGGNTGTLGNIVPPVDGSSIPSLPGLTDLPGVPALPGGLSSLTDVIPLTDLPGTDLPGLPALPNVPALVQNAPALATTLLKAVTTTPAQ